jgi:hypothetical protein
MPSSRKIKIFNNEKLSKSKKEIFERALKQNESVLGLDGSESTAQPLNATGLFG